MTPRETAKVPRPRGTSRSTPISDPAAAAQAVYTRNARILPPGASMVEGRNGIAQFWTGAAKQLNVERVELSVARRHLEHGSRVIGARHGLSRQRR